MNSLLTVLTIDVLLTLGVIDAPPWLYTVFLVGMVLVFGMPISDGKKKKKLPKLDTMALQFEESEKQGNAPEGWDYDYSVYRCKFDVV